ncbi:uncharacterized protein C2845_PM07G21630 [Panicum miliaceum]|uniref:DUF1677 family protein n=1 Tax=Panicum miliaceum TaxID=4540 RepID=A0A3L6SMD0_PANMI|nr:uncharacterized protein C2845_PM07G21630 [Panicum miliaceum]
MAFLMSVMRRILFVPCAGSVGDGQLLLEMEDAAGTRAPGTRTQPIERERERVFLPSGGCTPYALVCIMEIESAKCECCGLREDCTREYIAGVKADFGGRWLCGLCSEAVRDEVAAKKRGEPEGAVKDHMSFCAKFGKKGPAFRVATSFKQFLLNFHHVLSATAKA